MANGVKRKRSKWFIRGPHTSFRVHDFSQISDEKNRWISVEVFRTPENKYTSRINDNNMLRHLGFETGQIDDVLEVIETFKNNYFRDARQVISIFSHLKQNK